MKASHANRSFSLYISKNSLNFFFEASIASFMSLCLYIVSIQLKLLQMQSMQIEILNYINNSFEKFLPFYLSIVFCWWSCVVINFQSMKKIKNMPKRPQSPRNTIQSISNLQPLASQRAKSNSQQLLKKYKQTIPTDISRQSNIPSKIRIVTEPIDERMLQLSQSYAKLSRSKKKEVRFESQHNSIKIKQKTLSNQKYQPSSQHTCTGCLGYQKQISFLKQELRNIVVLKNQWKNGQLILDDFAKDQETKRNQSTERQFQAIVAQIRSHFYDLMKDIEVLTQVDYAKLLAFDLINNEVMASSTDEEKEIKNLLGELKQQANGMITLWDFDEQRNSQSLRIAMRNVKVNYMHSIRENLELRTMLSLYKHEGKPSHEQIKKVVSDVINHLKN